MVRALTFSFLLLAQSSSAQRFFKEMGAGFIAEFNYLHLTNDGGRGFGHGEGVFVFFPIGNHLELKADIYQEAPCIRYQFNYTAQTQSSIRYISEEGKEKIDVSPFMLQLNYFPGNQKGFFVGAGFAPRQVFLLKVDGKATYTGTDYSSNQPISGSALAAGSQTQLPDYGSTIFTSRYIWVHGGVLNAGYKYKFVRVTGRVQYSFSNVIVDDFAIVSGYEFINYPSQHLMVLSITADIDLVILTRKVLEKIFSKDDYSYLN